VWRIGRGSRRSGNRGDRHRGGQKLKVVMNRVNVSDINRDLTSDEWEKLRTCGRFACIHQRREYLANCGSSGQFDGRGGGFGRGGSRGYADRGSYGGRGGGRYAHKNRSNDQPRTIAATAASALTEIVEYVADAPNAPARAPAAGGDRGGKAGARFGTDVSIDEHPQHLAIVRRWGGLWQRSRRA
jgi:hypothetical protein